VLCSSIVVVSKGSLAAVGSPSDLKAKYASGYHLVAALDKQDAGSYSGASAQARVDRRVPRTHQPSGHSSRA
jgi:hypothetical protein